MEHRQQVGDELIGARQRRGAEADVVGPHPEALGDAARGPHRRLVGQAGPFGTPRRPRRIREVRDVRLRDDVGRRRRGLGQYVTPAERAVLGPVEAEVVLDRRQVGAMAVDGVEVVAGVDEHARRGVVDVVVQAVRVLEVDEGADGPQSPRPEHRQEVVEPVVGEDADPVAGADTERAQGAGHLVGGGDGLRVGQAAVPIHPMERRSVGRPAGSVGEEIEDAHPCHCPRRAVPDILARDRTSGCSSPEPW